MKCYENLTAFYVCAPYSAVHTPTGVCCRCRNDTFRVITSYPGTDLLLCPICNHKIKVVYRMDPKTQRICTNCGHSCAHCSTEPSQALRCSISCRACTATTIFHTEDDEEGNPRGRKKLFIFTGDRRWDRRCDGCGYNPKPWKHESGVFQRQWISYTTIYDPFPIMIVNE